MRNLATFLMLAIIVSSLYVSLGALNEEQTAYSQSSSATMNTTTTDNNSTRVQGKSVNYYGNSSGYLVHPSTPVGNTTTIGEQQQKLPAVVMIHEWWGLNDNIKNAAEDLANEGYVVLSADLYNGEVATDPDRAGQLASSVRSNPEQAIANLQSAVGYLGSLENVNNSRIASLGWCFGGGQSLQLALNSEENPLAATVIYYGNLVNDTNELSKINWPVLGVFGDQDESISVESVNAFERALNQTGVTNEIYIYPGVGHAFANPSGDNYAPEQTADAWEKALAFLAKYV